MTSPLDIVALPGVFPTRYARRFMVEKWIAAGRPPINDAGRLYQQQLDARLASEGGWGAPADDPREPWKYPLAHTRFVAFDIDATDERVRALSAQGLVRPFSYEPWHWTVPNVYDYPIVKSIPATAGDGSTPFNPPAPSGDVTMSYAVSLNGKHFFHIGENGFIKHFATNEKVGNEKRGVADLTKDIVSSTDTWITLDLPNFLNQLDSFGIPRWVVDVDKGQVQNPATGKFEVGGTWSWARLAAENTTKLLSAKAPEVVEPPKA